MTTQKFMFTGALLAAAAALPACSPGREPARGGVAEQAEGPSGTNDISPIAIDAAPLTRPVTNAASLTTPGNADVLQLCKTSTVTSSGCTMRNEWESWLNADLTP